MSLTDFIEIPEIKEWLRQEFIMPKLTEKREILAPPISTNYSLVGTAFDYLLRFYIEKLNPKAITRKWIAENFIERAAYINKKDGRKKGKLELEAEKIVAHAKKLHSKYMGQVTTI